MKRKINTPGAKVAAVEAKDAFKLLCASQIAEFLITANLWRGAVTAEMVPPASSQVKYLNHAGFDLGNFVMLTSFPGEPWERYEHVRLLVCGAVSFALPGSPRTAYTTPPGNARVFILVELAMPPVGKLTRWIPADRLQRKSDWKNVT